MKEFLAQLLRGGRSDLTISASPLPTAPNAGQIYSFRTKPYSEFSPPVTNRYAAFKILGVDARLVSVAVLDGIWPAPPNLKDARAASIMKEHRFAHTGRQAVFGVNREWWQPDDDLEELRFVGTQAVSAAERSLAHAIASFAVGTRMSTINAANFAAEGEWRWANDRQSFLMEAERQRANIEAERAAKKERYRNRLRKLTWEQLLLETPFERWSTSPPFPPDDFTSSARGVIRDAYIALRRLGSKPRRAEVRTILKETIQWFNKADEKAGGVIETEEREDICAVLEEMAHVARQTTLIDEIDDWREW